MKCTRLVWAAGMMAASVAVMLGLSTAGAALPLEQMEERAALEAVFAPLQIELPQRPVIRAPSEDTLSVAVRSDELEDGARLSFFDRDGELVTKAALDLRIGAVCRLKPGADYMVQAMDGLTATFHLEENGSVSNVEGEAWTDGEMLHLTRQMLGTVTVLAPNASALEQTAQFTLRGAGYEQIRSVGPESHGKAVFAGLSLGDYVLEGPDGQTRQVQLTQTQRALSVSLE